MNSIESIMEQQNPIGHVSKHLNTNLLQKLSMIVNEQATAAIFACGGCVPLSDPTTCNPSREEQHTIPDVTLRWDVNPQSASKISFPLHSQGKLQELLSQCQRATFGLDGQDVLDESYRKASKLDTSEFSTNFHPHDCGIMDSVQQILLPSTIDDRGQGLGIWGHGVRAELYKLNVWTGQKILFCL